VKLPRDITGEQLVRVLTRFGYVAIRQTGSHVRMRTMRNGEHLTTVPQHRPIKVGTLAAILDDVAQHAGLTREELLRILDL
jgi:predicted RNA binding protein YcfA (HicA-like mRNA interferase family)